MEPRVSALEFILTLLNRKFETTSTIEDGDDSEGWFVTEPFTDVIKWFPQHAYGSRPPVRAHVRCWEHGMLIVEGINEDGSEIICTSRFHL